MDPAVPSEHKEALHGVILHAQQNTLTLIRVRRKDDPSQEVTLLCCQMIIDNALRMVPVAEFVFGIDVDEHYKMPATVRALIGNSSDALDCAIPGVDKPG